MTCRAKIGDKFGTLTVIEKLENKGNQARFKVKCSVCSEDEELFGDGTFDVYSSVLLKGGRPCGCSNFKLNASQYLTKIKRLSRGRFTAETLEEDFKGLKTKATLSCTKCSAIWKTTVSCLLKGYGCPKCRSSSLAKINTKEDEVLVRGFNNGLGWVDKKFVRSEKVNKNGYKMYFNYFCDICSNDEYVKENLCTGLFQSDSSSLKSGRLSCRCSKRYLWTEQQREYQLERYLSTTNKLSFLGWEDGYKNNSSFVKLSCSDHGDFSVSFSNLMSANSGCPSCCITGFDKMKPSWLYIVLVEGDDRNFTGFGISNVIDKRLRKHYNSLSKLNLEMLEVVTYPLDGTLAAGIEKEIGKNFEIVSQGIEGFIKEATYGENFNSVIKFVEGKINEQRNSSTSNRNEDVLPHS